MKSLVAFIVLVLSFAAFASAPAGYTKVPAEKMASYKQAIADAIHANTNAVGACNPAWINQAYDQTVDIYLAPATADQPLLLFDSYFGPGNQEMHRMAFFTTPDHKSLTKVHAEVYLFQQTNSGDLANPVYTTDYVLQSRSDCTRY